MNFDIYKQNIQLLMSEHYPKLWGLDSDISDMIIEQLYWVQESNQFTPQAEILYQPRGEWQQHLHREVFRALSRIECLLSLWSLNLSQLEAVYAQFTKKQPESDKLSIASFIAMHERIKQLTPEQMDAQIRASLIASVTLSPRAKELAGEGYSYDSVMFSGFTISNSGDMYPSFATASESVQLWIRACFPNDVSHWRHAFFLENKGSLGPWKQKIVACDVVNKDRLKADMSMWLDYWMINTLGFEGHIEPFGGSLFMTESVYQRLHMLNQALTNSLDASDSDVLANYSQACVQALGLDIQNPFIALFMVRLLNMANLFNPKAASELREVIKGIDYESIQNHADVFNAGKTVTYLPALLQNAYKLTHDISILPKALLWASQVVEQSTYSIVSLRLVSGELLSQLVSSNFSDNNWSLNEKGEIIQREFPSLTAGSSSHM